MLISGGWKERPQENLSLSPVRRQHPVWTMLSQSPVHRRGRHRGIISKATYQSHSTKQRTGLLTFQNSCARSLWDNSELYRAPFDFTIYNCSDFESCVAEPGGSIIHNLSIIALASNSLTEASRQPENSPFKKKKAQRIYLPQFCQFKAWFQRAPYAFVLLASCSRKVEMKTHLAPYDW